MKVGGRHHCQGVTGQGKPIPAPHFSHIVQGCCHPALYLSPGWLSWEHSSASFPAPSSSQKGGLWASLCALGPEAPPVVQSKGGPWWREKGKALQPRASCLDSHDGARFFFLSPEPRPPRTPAHGPVGSLMPEVSCPHQPQDGSHCLALHSCCLSSVVSSSSCSIYLSPSPRGWFQVPLGGSGQ